MIVAGFGFRSGASQDSLQDAFERAKTSQTPSAFATLKDKADALRGFAESNGIPLIAVDGQQARVQETLTQSAASQSHRATGSVAEATALAAAGPNARLLGPRAISTDRMATCAIAIGDIK